MLVAQLFAAVAEIEHEGRRYTFREPTVEEIGRYCSWLESEARAAVGRAVDLPVEMHEKQIRGLTQDIAAGVYGYGSEVYLRRLATPSGAKKYCSIIWPDVPPKRIDKLVDERFKLVAELVRACHERDPKAMAQILRDLGLPENFLDSGSSDSATPPSEPPPTSPPSAE